MHTETLEASSEEPDSPESDPHHNTYFENNDNFVLLKFKDGEACISILEKCWLDIFRRIDMKELGVIIETVINFSSHPLILPNKRTTLSIVATDNAHMCKLNADFRNKPIPTNILSFSDGSIDQTGDEFHLGDIFLGYEIVNKEAKPLNIPLKNHLNHLIVHGVLHLLGYEHEDEIQAQIMENKEKKILGIFNIPNPYSL